MVIDIMMCMIVNSKQISCLLEDDQVPRSRLLCNCTKRYTPARHSTSACTLNGSGYLARQRECEYCVTEGPAWPLHQETHASLPT